MSVEFDAQSLKSSKLHDFSNWVAVVTGGGTGLGYITAATLAIQGARVYITGRRTNVLEEAVSKFESQTNITGQIIPFQCDLTIKEQIVELEKFIGSKEKYINILVNNAGTGGVKNRSVNLPLGTTPEGFSKALLECTQKTWDDVMHINTSSVYFTTGS